MAVDVVELESQTGVLKVTSCLSNLGISFTQKIIKTKNSYVNGYLAVVSIDSPLPVPSLHKTLTPNLTV